MTVLMLMNVKGAPFVQMPGKSVLIDQATIAV